MAADLDLLQRYRAPADFFTRGLAEGDPAVEGRPVVVDQQAGVGDGDAAREPDLLEPVGDRLGGDHVAGDHRERARHLGELGEPRVHREHDGSRGDGPERRVNLARARPLEPGHRRVLVDPDAAFERHPAQAAGEESGLLGSGHFVDEPTRPLPTVEAMLNFDMVGRLRDRRLLVMGAGTAAEFPGLLERVNRSHGQASFGAADYDRLSDLGHRQCVRLGQYLRERGARFEAVVTGTLKRNGYRIEKIVFESQPTFYVTANLYLPETGRAPYPGILMPLGHESGGKAHEAWQRLAITFAKNGFAILLYEPISQGERVQLYDPDLGESKARQATNEHTLAGTQAPSTQCTLTQSASLVQL